MSPNNTVLLVDAHVHLYPQYDLDLAFRSGVDNLVRAYRETGQDLPSNALIVWLLTERHDCRLFDEIKESPDLFSHSSREVRMGKEAGAVLIRQKGRPDLYLLAGRQLISSDGLEILALAGWNKCPDRQVSTADLISQVNACGAIPVLNWAPGKWFFKRGEIVREIIEGTSPADFVIGDTPLRHTLWPRPGLMKNAIRKGVRMLAGSDPLPFKGEESMIGTYGNAFRAEFNPEEPVSSVRRILKGPAERSRIIGRRNHPFKFAWREARILMT